MSALAYTLFDTAIGRCGIAWTARGIARVQLPEATESQTRARLVVSRSVSAQSHPPTDVADAIQRVVALLRGESVDLRTIALDMSTVSQFQRSVYEATRSIPPGATSTYGTIAAQIRAPGGARAVGHALGQNPFAIVVPCHRVLAANGKVGGFSANGGAATKLRLLAIERAGANIGLPLFDSDRSPVRASKTLLDQ